MVLLNKRFVKLLASAALAVCVFGGSAFAQTQTAKKETAAVYVYGSHPRQETIKEAVIAYMIKIKKYKMIDLEAIEPALAEMQRQDNIATDQIAQVGYDKGAKWLCFVKLTLDKVSGETVIRITMVETQSKEATDTDIKVLPRDTDMNEMLDFIKKMIRDMLSVNDESVSAEKTYTPSGGSGSGYTGGSYTSGGSGSRYTSASNEPSKPVIYDYTASERATAIFLNLVLPGWNIGTLTMLDDKDNYMNIANFSSCVLGSIGIFPFVLAATFDKGDPDRATALSAGLGILGFSFVLNSSLTLVARKPNSVRASVPSDGLNIAVFPSNINGSGGLKGYVSYSASF
jgi:hypothetical protein